jgi:hypothetical protein
VNIKTIAYANVWNHTSNYYESEVLSTTEQIA